MTGRPEFRAARELLAGLRTGALSSVELVERALQRAHTVGAHFNAIVSLDEAGALARAHTADQLARQGRFSGALHGLPLTIKDCFDVAGLPTANGAPELRDYRPARHAEVVQRLTDAGAIIIGKSNVPLFSLDLQTYNDVVGTTRNPWDPLHTPGGSSGGAAVALATGVSALEIGSDLAGSLRIPAHYTGVCSLKTTVGIVPTRGVLAPAPGMLRHPDLLVVGPMARSVGDLAVLLDVIAGPDPEQASAWRLALPPSRAPAPALRVAAWLDDPLCPVDADVAGPIEAACAALEKAGVTIDRGARPGFDARAGFETFFRLMYGEMSAGFPDAVYRAFQAAAKRIVPAEEWTPLSIMPMAVTQTHREWLAASEQRERWRSAWAEFFTRFDVLLTPVAPSVAPAHDQRPFEERSIRLGGQDFPYMQQAFWCALATTAGLPAAVVPIGLSAAGLPVGLQVIAPHLGDRTALAFAGLVEEQSGGFRPPPSD